MLEPDPYLIRYEVDGEDQYVPIDKFEKTVHACGLKAGDRIKVIREVICKDSEGRPSGKVMAVGEVHTVLKGSYDDPHTLPLHNPDGELHMWDDDESVWESFERVVT